jgi:hypothetical protein
MQQVSENDILKALEDLDGLIVKSQITTGGGSGKGNMKSENQNVTDRISNGTDYKGPSSKASKAMPPQFAQAAQAAAQQGGGDDEEDDEEDEKKDDDREDPEAEGDDDQQDPRRGKPADGHEVTQTCPISS